MPAQFTFTFTDLATRESDAIESRRSALAELGRLKKPLSDADQKEFDRLTAIDGAANFDPLFVGAKSLFEAPDTGLTQVTVKQTLGVLAVTGGTHEPARMALILGLLQLGKTPLPPLVSPTAIDTTHPNTPLFKSALFGAVLQVVGQLPLATAILDCLGAAVSRGIADPAKPTSVSVSALELAEVFTKLVAKGTASDDPNLKRLVEECLDQVQAIGEERPLHEMDINLPDLEATADFAIEPNHCKLMGSFIFASALEELRAFQVVDRIVEMSQRGELPLTRGDAGTRLYNYWREAPNRMREDERQTFYAMTLGLPTGQPGVAVNSDFQDLWLRFVSSVSSLVRESRVDQILRSTLPASMNQQQVKKAARDLGMNMSARGYGMVFYAAADLQKQINDMIALLQDKELRAAFGARDMWQVIDQVAQTELGGARNSSKYRMLATSGAIITSWMAKNVSRMLDPTLPMIDLNSITNAPSRLRGQTAVSHPTDYDLVNACEMWLADSAMGEDRVEQMSQPRESPAQTSRPIQIPSVARDLLEGAGLGMGMGANGFGRNNGRGISRYQGY